MQRNDTRSELLKWEKNFAKAAGSNDADAICKFLADDWVIIEPDGISTGCRVSGRRA